MNISLSGGRGSGQGAVKGEGGVEGMGRLGRSGGGGRAWIDREGGWKEKREGNITRH